MKHSVINCTRSFIALSIADGPGTEVCCERHANSERVKIRLKSLLLLAVKGDYRNRVSRGALVF